MNTIAKVKLDILRDALTRIACASFNSDPIALAHIASTALRDLNAVAQYRIEARTYIGRDGGKFKAELRTVDTGFLLAAITGTSNSLDAWAFAMRDAMALQQPEKFKPHHGESPTVYFREVVKVDYFHKEVQRLRDYHFK